MNTKTKEIDAARKMHPVTGDLSKNDARSCGPEVVASGARARELVERIKRNKENASGRKRTE